MSSIQQKYPNGRVVAATALPTGSNNVADVILVGSGPGFLGRVLASGVIPPIQHHTIVTPRAFAIPGRQRVLSFGPAEAMAARDAKQTSAVAPSWPATVATMDATPIAQIIQQRLGAIPPAHRHDLTLSTLRELIGLDKERLAAAYFIVEMPVAVKDLATRLRTPATLAVGVADHLMVELCQKGTLGGLGDGSRFILVSNDLNLVARVNPKEFQGSETAQVRVSLGRVDVKFRMHQVDVDGSTDDTAPPPTTPELIADAEASDVKTVAEDEAERLSAGMSAAAAGESTGQMTPREQAEQAKLAERSAALVAAQSKATFIGRGGVLTTFGDHAVRRQDPKLIVAKARGTFLSEHVSRPSFDAITSSYFKSGTYDRDMAKVLTSLSTDPVVPMYVEKMTREDSSDAMSAKETVSVTYRDSKGRSGTVRFDLPLFTRDGYATIGGVKLNITKQILAKPIIKVRPTEVLLTTAYNKAVIERFGQNASPRSTYIRMLAQWISRNPIKGVSVEMKAATPSNRGFNSTVEYDDIARVVRTIRTDESALIFSRPELANELSGRFAWSTDLLMRLEGDGSHAVGWCAEPGRAPLIICVDKTGNFFFLGEGGTITKPAQETSDLAMWAYRIVNAKVTANAESAPPAPSIANRKYTYSRVKMLSQYLPTSVIVGYDLGLIPMLKRAEIPFKLVERAAFQRGKNPGYDPVVFEDAVVLTDASKLRWLLITNGLKELDTEERPLADFGPAGMGWVDHIADRLGSPGHARGLLNFQASFIDPITRDYLEDLKLPTDMAGVLLYASSLLEDNTFRLPNDMESYRLRGPELVNALLYKALHTEMQKVRMTRESASPQRLSIAQGEIIRQLVSSSNVEEVKELNPLDEADIRSKASWTGAAGGLGDGRVVTRTMRAFHPSMHGLFGYASPDSQEIGVKRQLSFGTHVDDVRGRLRTGSAVDNASRALGVGELISPFSSRHSDPPRYWASHR